MSRPAVAAVTLALVATLPAPAMAAPGPRDGTRVTSTGGRTEPVYSYKSAIRETAYVQSSVDGDRDGKPDRIAADIIRPAETQAGLKVPVIMVASPYFARPRTAAKSGGGFLEPALDDDYKDTVDDGTPSKFPEWYDNYFVPRGYAVVLVDMPGTRASEGCLTSGGRTEVLGTKAVVDWIGGRASATNKAGEAVQAGWSTGKVGMVGRSWRGTVANAIATLDTPNLTTIVPISSIGSWYDYMRQDGQVRFKNWATDLARRNGTRVNPQVCEPVFAEMATQTGDDTGNYNAYWAERDHAKDAGKVKASVLMVHGLNDWNVQARHAQRYWEKLSGPRKLWLHQAAHVDPVQVRPAAWIDTLHRWFDYWLQGIDNGVMAEPQATIEQTPGQWVNRAAWPAPNPHNQRYWFTAPTEVGKPGGLTATEPTPPGLGYQQTFTDSLDQGARALTAAPETEKPNRLVFLGPPVSGDTRVSGVVKVNLQAKVSAGGGPLSAFLVDYGPGAQVAHDADFGQSGLLADGEQCIGQGDEVDTGCIRKMKPDVRQVEHEVVAEGWMNTKHHESLQYVSPVVPGKLYNFNLTLQPEDFVVKAGHRLGVVIAATDCTEMSEGCEAAANGQTPWPAAKVTLNVGTSSIVLPTARLDAG